MEGARKGETRSPRQRRSEFRQGVRLRLLCATPSPQGTPRAAAPDFLPDCTFFNRFGRSPHFPNRTRPAGSDSVVTGKERKPSQ